jgi:uncharacterized SAM-binding protein YcdF (DUF218 family)
MRKLWAVLAVLILLVALPLSTSGWFLIVNNPQHADVIVVLAGETDRRPSRALDLLRAGYAAKLQLDVPAASKVYDQQTLAIAQTYVNGLADRQSITICPIFGLSTKTEAQDVARCLGKTPSKRILLVTSDYHTRRALRIFKHELGGHDISVAAASDPSQFGDAWWEHRQWAKINFDEWLRLVWWEVVDRWRS